MVASFPRRDDTANRLLLVKALCDFRKIDDRHGEGMALNNLAGSLLKEQRIEEPIAADQSALEIFRESRDRYGQGRHAHLGGAVRFGGAKFSGALVDFRGAKSSGCALDFSHVAVWERPPEFREGPPPAWITVPPAALTEAPSARRRQL